MSVFGEFGSAIDFATSGKNLSQSQSSVTTLDKLASGATGRIVDISDTTVTGDRLLEMGLTPGTSIEIVRRSFGTGLMQLRVRGYMLSLRHQQAQSIRIVQP